MALLADGSFTTLEQLQAIDAAVAEVARVERVDLEHKLEMAADEVGLRIKKFLIEHGLASRVAGVDGEVDFGRIVVTAGLQRWHALETLAMVYSDAYFSQLNDRYRRKWDHYRERASEAGRLLFDTGIAAVSVGVRRAMVPVLEETLEPYIPATYYVSIVWRNPSGVTGEPSAPAVLSTTNLFRVRAAEDVPAGWTFDVYVGLSLELMSKQNAEPVLATEFWQMTLLGLLPGAELPGSQTPEYFLRHERLWQRG